MNDMVNTMYLPTEEEKREVKSFLWELLAELRSKYNSALRITAVGSTAKETYVSGEHDIDVYLIVDDPQLELNRASELCPTSGFCKHAGPLVIWTFKQKGFAVDLIFGKPGSIKTDTVEHTSFFNAQLTETMKREIVLAKAYFKNYGVYSAEIGGITGVALEELTRLHESFENVCKLLQHSEWPWLQDPVLKEPRNLLASVIPKRQEQIREVCHRYLIKHTFNYKPFTFDQFKASYSGYDFTVFRRKKEMSLDFTIVYSVCRHVLNGLKNLERDMFATSDFDVWLDATHIFVASSLANELGERKIVEINKKFSRGIEAFKSAHPNWFDAEQSIKAEVPRKIIRPSKHFTEKLIEKLRDMGYVYESLP